MKFRSLLIIALAAAIPAIACAKKPKKDKNQPVVEEVVDPYKIAPDECEDYFSLEHESLKNKQYQDAYEQWMAVFKSCPDIQRQLYTDGGKILEALYQQTQDEAEKVRLANLIMEMYDQRMKYFGDDERYPVSYILSLKALDYRKYFEGTQAYSRDTVYAWLHEAMQYDQASPSLQALEMLFTMSMENYMADKEANGDAFVQDYNNVEVGLEILINDSTYENAELAQGKKDYYDQLFAGSGAADCAKLDEIYGRILQDNLDNYSKLYRLASLYRQMGCTESDVYKTAIENMKRLRPAAPVTKPQVKPTTTVVAQPANTSANQAKACMNKKDYAGAIANFKKAVGETSSAQEKADYYYYMAVCAQSLKDYPGAVNYAKQSLGVKAGQGRCYIVIGTSYAQAKPYTGGSGKDKILNKTVFWAACDMFEMAKKDPSTAAQAAKLIAQYSKYFPTKEDRFDLPNEFKGATFHVGGWVNVTTRIR